MNTKKGFASKFYPLFISAIVLLIYIYPVLRCDFIWDSQIQIETNPIINGNEPLINAFKTGFWYNNTKIEMVKGNYYRSLVIITMGFEKRIFGNSSYYFHIINLIIFILSSVFLYFLLNFYFDKSISFLISLLFSLHPLNSDNVFWIVALSDLLAMMCFFGFFYFLKKYMKESAKKKAIFYFVLSFIFLFTGFFSKETFSLYALAIIIIILLEEKSFSKKITFLIFSYTLIFSFYLFMRKLALINEQKFHLIFPYKSFTNFLLISIKTIGFYFKYIISPFNYKMFITTKYLGIQDFLVGIMALLLLTIIIYFYAFSKKKHKYFILIILLIGFYPMVLLISPVFPFSISTRYSYLLTLFIIIAFIESLKNMGKYKYIFISIILIFFVIQINITGFYYINNVNFWGKTYRDMPENSFVLTAYANNLFKVKEYKKAEKLFKKALRYKINNVYTAFILALRLSEIELMKGNYNQSLKWLKSIENVVKDNPQMMKIINKKREYMKIIKNKDHHHKL